MNFLQPAMLMALPVVALPIVIHLINQWRYQTVPWGAMAFLISANRMSRGYARIRQWLILAMRMLALAGLIFVISRPLSSGWLGLATGTQVDTTIIVLDRSPSMMQRGVGGQTKLAAARERLIDSLEVIPSNRYVLIDSVTETPLEIAEPEVLRDLPSAGPSSVTADLPSMLESVGDYIRDNRPSRCEIWICSDVRRSDWLEESGRWEAIRSGFLELPQMIRFHLLAYTEPAPANRSIQVTNARRVSGESGSELLLSLQVRQSAPLETPIEIPVGLELGGARSELALDMTDQVVDLVNYSIPLDDSQSRGWGRVSLPADTNEADNDAYFVFDEPAERTTLIVTEDPQDVTPLQLAAEIPPAQGVVCQSQVLAPDELLGVDWDQLALVIWHAEIPGGQDAAELQSFVQRGGYVFFFPPRVPGDESFASVRWTGWQEFNKPTGVVSWVGDQDLLAATNSGTSLPVGQLAIERHCGITGKTVALASLDGGEALLARAATDLRNVYFCTTTCAPGDSTLAKDGIVLYVMVQRALAAGADSLGQVSEYVAGALEPEIEAIVDSGGWEQVAGPDNAVSTEFDTHAGIYAQDEKLIAIRRAPREDEPTVVSAERVSSLFEGLAFDRVDDTADSNASLVQEIWRFFLILMIAALLIEAVLCLPRKPQVQSGGAIA